MDLLSLLPHMRGQTIRVNGTEYAIDERGLAKDVSEADAAKLLQNRQGWKQQVERKPLAQTEELPPAPPAPVVEESLPEEEEAPAEVEAPKKKRSR